MIATDVIHAAHVHGVEKFLFLGSSCSTQISPSSRSAKTVC